MTQGADCTRARVAIHRHGSKSSDGEVLVVPPLPPLPPLLLLLLLLLPMASPLLSPPPHRSSSSSLSALRGPAWPGRHTMKGAALLAEPVRRRSYRCTSPNLPPMQNTSARVGWPAMDRMLTLRPLVLPLPPLLPPPSSEERSTMTSWRSLHRTSSSRTVPSELQLSTVCVSFAGHSSL